MSEQIGILAAMPGEVAPLVRHWRRLPRSGRISAWHYSTPGAQYTAVCGGMGAGAATRSFAHLLTLAQPSLVLSVGWAGALGVLEPGAVCRPTQIIDTRTGERFCVQMALHEGESALVTAAAVASREEKSRLRAAYPGAVAVDMEASTVARLAAANGIAFRSIKAISDGASADLPDLNPFLDAEGQFALVRFTVHAAVRPGTWRPLMRFGAHARAAANNLCEAIRIDLQLQDEP